MMNRILLFVILFSTACSDKDYSRDSVEIGVYYQTADRQTINFLDSNTCIFHDSLTNRIDTVFYRFQSGNKYNNYWGTVYFNEYTNMGGYMFYNSKSYYTDLPVLVLSLDEVFNGYDYIE